MIRRERSSRRTYYYFPDHSIYAVSLCVTVLSRKKKSLPVAHVSIIFDLDTTIITSLHPDVSAVLRRYRLDGAHRLSAVQQLPGVIRGYGRHLNRLPKCLRKLLGLFSFLAKRDVRTLPDRCFFLESK